MLFVVIIVAGTPRYSAFSPARRDAVSPARRLQNRGATQEPGGAVQPAPQEGDEHLPPQEGEAASSGHQNEPANQCNNNNNYCPIRVFWQDTTSCPKSVLHMAALSQFSVARHRPLSPPMCDTLHVHAVFNRVSISNCMSCRGVLPCACDGTDLLVNNP